MIELFGRLHPLIVHLPIGFLLLGILFQLYDHKKQQLPLAVSLSYLWGGCFALTACLSGYVLYTNEGYAFDSIKYHLWMGVATAVLAFALYFRSKKQRKFFSVLASSATLFFLISATGHLGGNLTHGETYLIEPLPEPLQKMLGYDLNEAEIAVTLDEEKWETQNMYTHVIQPILSAKCVSCHNEQKTKGELMLHTQESMLKGGADGPILAAGDASNSTLYARMVLPKHDELHMPPDGKKQPSKAEIEIIKTWIDKGASFDQSLGELGIEKKALLASFPEKVNDDYPLVVVPPADPDTVKALKEQRIYVDQLSEGSNLLQITCINKPQFSDDDLQRLLPLKEQVTVLDLGGTKITDAIFSQLKLFPHLSVLKLQDTQVTGKGIEQLAACKYLRLVNLVGSDFSATHLNELIQLEKLQKVYLFGTEVPTTAVAKLDDQLAVKLDLGGYSL